MFKRGGSTNLDPMNMILSIVWSESSGKGGLKVLQHYTSLRKRDIIVSKIKYFVKDLTVSLSKKYRT